MAKMTPGPVVAAISGSMGGTVFSHNRGGAYFRNRSIPITSTTSFALNAKARLSAASQDWQGLTDAQRASWLQWALQNPVTDTLGFPRHLTGHQAFVGINTRLLLLAQSTLTAPPIVAAPDGLLTLALQADIGLGDTDITFTATPTGAGIVLWIEAAVTNSQGINNVNSLLRFVGSSAAAQASPFDIQSIVETRLGTLIVGQKLFVRVSTFDVATGLLSLPLVDAVVVTTT